MLKAYFEAVKLHFTKPVHTSRGTYSEKQIYLLKVFNKNTPDITGIGECTVLPDLSIDARPEYINMLHWLCNNINRDITSLTSTLAEWPSIVFGLETALLDLQNGGKGIIFGTDFTRGLESIPINGLVWMGDYEYMHRQISEKIEQGFSTIKLKIGSLDFNRELELLKFIRSNFPQRSITIRLDANGAFHPSEALNKLENLAKYDIHSIEQPIRQGQHLLMHEICKNSPILIALDEELIGCHAPDKQLELLETIQPAFLIFKPSLIGGFEACNAWARLCDNTGTGYWLTSALESNIGLNAIAQYTATIHRSGMVHGLGTGSIFKTNFNTGLLVENGHLLKHAIPFNG